MVWKTCGCCVKPQESLNRELWNLALRGEEEKKTTLSGKVVTDTPYLARCARIE